MAATVIAAAVAMRPVLDNGFTNWDDPGYVAENLLIRDFDPAAYFTLPSFSGNYHPLTLTLLSVEYRLFGEDPAGYHAVSYALHLLCTALVFLFIALLSESLAAAFAAALLFGVHPMHVEPVSWIADQKDILYALFLFAGLVAWILRGRSIQSGRPGRSGRLYLAALACFLLALFSKGLAVTFPLMIILVDHHLRRKLRWRETVPFFALAIGFGLLAVQAQSSAGAVSDLPAEGFAERIIYPLSSATRYLIRLLAPVDLSPFHPYPQGIDALLVIAAAAAIALAAFLVGRRRRHPRLFFGISFFAVSLAPVLQWLQVGSAIMSDRYVYVASVGVFFVVGAAVASGVRPAAGLKTRPRWAVPAAALFGLYVLLLAVQSTATAAVWRDGVSLWTRVVERYPGHPKGYFNRGNGYHAAGEYQAAIDDFNAAIVLAPRYPYAHFNRGLSHYMAGRPASALVDYDSALAGRPLDPEIHFRRAQALEAMKSPEAAIDSYTRAVALDRSHEGALSGRALLLTAAGNYGAALPDFTALIAIQPANPDYLFNRGNIFAALGRYDEAIGDYSRALALSPRDAAVLHARGAVHTLAGDVDAACGDFRAALSLGFARAGSSIAQYCR